MREPAAEHGGGAEKPTRLRGQPVDAAADDLVDRGGNGRLGLESALVANGDRELLEEERVTLGASQDGLRQRSGRVAQDPLHDAEAVLAAERRQRHLRGVRVPIQPGW